MGAYPDLIADRYTVIADFERAEHRKLFTLEGPPDAKQPKRNRKSGIQATGAMGLRCVLRSSADVLITDNRNATSRPLASDWRDYRLLLASVYSPLAGLELELAIGSGSDESKSEAISSMPLEKGWNRLHLDLADAAPMVDLSDVQRLQWRIPGLAAPVELFFDDIMLADNRLAISGQPRADKGRLYVEREGRHINVGAAGRFELSFGNGQIVRWYALDRDASRKVNLLGSAGSLGPMPVVLTDPDSDFDPAIPSSPRGYSSLGRLVAARQRVLEANDVVVVVECTWSFPESIQNADDRNVPFQRWTYAIYPTGQIYVTVECTTEHGEFKPEFLAMVVSRKLVGNTVAGKHEPTGLHGEPMLQHLSFAWIAEPSTETGLLWVMHNSRQYPQLRGFTDARSESVSVAAYGGIVDRPTHRASFLLSIWPKGNCSQSNREAQAVGYSRKMNVEVTVGELQLVSKGDPDGDGFNQRLGAFMLKPNANQIHVKLDGSGQALINPVFCVEGVNEKEAWVYVDYAVHEQVARTSDGRLVVQIPREVTGESVLEIYLKNPPSDRQ
ncbi:MAG: hypothetical protein GXP29_09330 [Planctomycetes bacterium]|nr:hypothetical protein [Planctomycetota bacterium]